MVSVRVSVSPCCSDPVALMGFRCRHHAPLTPPYPLFCSDPLALMGGDLGDDPFADQDADDVFGVPTAIPVPLVLGGCILRDPISPRP